MYRIISKKINDCCCPTDQFQFQHQPFLDLLLNWSLKFYKERVCVCFLFSQARHSEETTTSTHPPPATCPTRTTSVKFRRQAVLLPCRGRNTAAFCQVPAGHWAACLTQQHPLLVLSRMVETSLA